MRSKCLEKQSVITIFIIVLVLTALFKLLGFSLLSDSAKVLVNVLIATLSIVSLKTTKFENISLRKTALIYLLLSISIIVFWRNTFLLLIVSISLLVYWTKLITRLKRPLLRAIIVGSGLLTLLIGSIIIFFSIVGSFLSLVEIEDVRRLDSPNGKFYLVSRSIDAGATGGNVAVDVEAELYFVKWERRLHIGRWGESPSLKWNGNYEVIINNKKLNIFMEHWDSRIR